MARKKPLTSAEKVVLCALLGTDGTWSSGDRPLWESRHWTITLLGALASKEMVREIVPDGQYELTNAGRIEAEKYYVVPLPKARTPMLPMPGSYRTVGRPRTPRW